MTATCPQCGTERTIKPDGRWQVYCGACGYDYRPDDRTELDASKKEVEENPDSPAAWMQYALALDTNNRKKEALKAVDNILPLFPDFSWELYQGVASFYSMFGDARFGRRLLADGILYHLNKHRDRLTSADLEEAGENLRNFAKEGEIEEFNSKSGNDRQAIRKVHLERFGVEFDDDPLPAINGLGAYELAKRFATPSSSKRLYPGSKNMTPTARKMEKRDKQIKRAVIWIVGLMLVLFSLMCVCSQCSS